MRNNKFYRKQAEDLGKKLDQETRKQICLVYGSAYLALWKNWQWRTEKLSRLIDVSYGAWDDCEELGHKKSVVQLLDEETGIELRLQEDGKSWREFQFLNGESEYKQYQRGLSYPQLIARRQGELKWAGAIIEATIFLALHRKEGFGFRRISRLLQQMFDIQNEFDSDPEKIREECRKVTKIKIETNLGETKIRPQMSREEYYFEMSAAEAVRKIVNEAG